MERSYRASNALYAYAFLLGLTALLLAIEALQRFRAGQAGFGAFLMLLALAWLGCAGYLLFRWGRLRVSLRSDTLAVTGDAPDRHLSWADVVAVREYRGPAYQLSLRGLLPGPYLPHGLVRGEAVLEIEARPAMRLHFRQALLDSYGAFRQDVLRSVGRDVPVDLHARWWKLDGPSRGPDIDAQNDDPDFEDGDADDFEDQPRFGARGRLAARPARIDRIDRTDRGAIDRLSPPRDRTTRPIRTDRADGADGGTRRSRDRRL
jgi:hypothetical protein